MEKTHSVTSKWREAEANALEERVKAISDWLEHTEDLLDIFSDDNESAGELRSVIGLVRMRSNDLQQKAEKIRAELADRDGNLS